ncbi:Ferredoxin-dependent glutamate synthase 1 [Achromobacter spanius]|jgi:glutamate synthase (NADPH/NADH) large chain|uniref:Glutamate synthase [NADPH] large chain n=1 Tax=Achromobacter spanius TaxID=217203 RepID=A0AA42LL01_9BURK|nr:MULTISPECIES: glutamate synthase-related protein [Achromobacter]SPT38304.1 Ferredoxin-dependent glutamate synthase 1 [Achromobacter denitrificans]AUA55445.1 glutamate synthase subunit alpha [Achromobacter spanius]MCS3509388.1 glutamate synthase (NADPH/NADH) large chain [Achromobacter sp. JUb104]MDH0734566.1 glutamate synthase-related protein [Achromobacter spanius]CAB3665595.1 Ferredoxin-dependent glutamate synthase 1 [Achromobacter spanius]
MPQITPIESCPTPKATPIDASRIGMPAAQGLYHPKNEHDACGVGFVAHIKGKKSHAIIQQGLKILENLDHRGAVGADKLMGDGAGILIQIPDTLYRDELSQQGIILPPPGEYGVAMVFLPKETASRLACEQELERSVRAEGQVVLGWRNVPVDVDMPMSPTVRDCEPVIRQLFIGRGADVMVPDALERKLYVIRKTASHAIQAMHLAHGKEYFVPSASVRTVVYKGLLLADQVGRYYRDLADTRTVSALALVHQRFSTNTFPAWPLAHPYRMIAHNGEINTVKGNFNWLRAREGMMQSAVLGDDLKKLYPIVYEGQSDTATFDNCLELLVNSGYSLAHAMMMMIPEAWEQHTQMDESRRAFYEYHAAMMEPWDGPAAVAFTDGRQIGATLDRNGLRPARYLVTDDDMVILASEAGTLSIPENRIVKKWRLQPGKMFLIDLEQGRIIDDAEIKLQLANSRPYRQWIERLQIKLESLPAPRQTAVATQSAVSLLDRQQAFGWTQEDYKFILEPMASTGEEVIGSMGNDAPLAVLSDRAKPFYNYFRQLFAQVTNPPIDPIREQLVMSLVSFIGPKPNLLDINNVNPPLRLEVSQPVLDFAAMAQIRDIEQVTGKKFRSFELDITYPAAWGSEGIEARVAALCARAVDAVQSGYNILIVSDRLVDSERVAIPALLATSAVHQHLIRAGLRTNTGLVVETGSAREVHHFALLGGYGAEAIHPYLALESLGKMNDPEKAVKNFIKAIGKGLNKVMSKMGISTYMSYTGAQIFEAVGLQSKLVDKYFTGTSSNIEGIGIFQVAEEALRQHRAAFSTDPVLANDLDAGGEYAYRVRGEEHMWTPDSIAKLQHASRANNYRTYKEYAQIINDQSRRHMTLRGLFEFRFDPTRAIPLDDVESAKDIVKRFATGAMSLGSISTEAHSVLAVAMNRIGGKSNTGEGGEDELRYRAEMREGKSTIKDGDTLASLLGSDRIEADVALKKGDSLRSKIKQVASGRFGVTAEYLSSADQIQIKMAQGAKPGEGGQLPGHKVSEYIAKLRYSVPGVGLISPPPHHDIYSIEDLAQLIHDLKNVNSKASVSVKLVSEVGVGTVAAGVAKAKADHVVIAGHDGGTGASPVSSIKHVGTPWELGLAETQQTLVLNRLRSRIRVQADGQMKTGRDVVIGALLGADEFGFATAPLVVEGCIMMRKCHLNTCPVGVATQDPVLRKKFQGKPEHVVNFFFFIAEEVREIMAQLGIRKFDDLIGRADLLDMRSGVEHWKAQGLDFARVFHQTQSDADVRQTEEQDHGLANALDHQLIDRSRPALERGEKVSFIVPVRNRNRTIGAMLSGAVASRYGHDGLPDDTIHIQCNGTAGQSFGAFLAHGITMDLVGEGNDYVGKGLSGGRIIVRSPNDFRGFGPDHIIAGNTVLYGALAGEAFFNGVAGERFAVRNSGAATVVEGTGDHGCEYMTGGTVVVLGATGRNFAAGMSGGVAYVWDPERTLKHRVNLSMVELESVAPHAEQQALNNIDIWHSAQRGGERETDETILRRLVEDHFRYTGSYRAREILGDWEASRGKFVKVMPTDYRRALGEMWRAANQQQLAA